MNKVFDMGIMACEDIQAFVGTCKFGTGDDSSFEATEVADGAFVVLGGLADDEVYAGEKDWNTYHAYAPETSSYERDEIAVIDLAEVSGGYIGGSYYKIGAKTVGLVAPKNLPIRYRKMVKGDKFWLGHDNFDSIPVIGEYATLTANSTILTTTSEKPTAKFGVVIRASKPLTQGTLVDFANGEYVNAYLVEVL